MTEPADGDAFPATAVVEAIRAVPHPLARNLAQGELSQKMAGLAGPGANWYTFATWASTPAGRAIRQEDLARRIEADLHGSGNLKVFAEVGRGSRASRRCREQRAPGSLGPSIGAAADCAPATLATARDSSARSSRTATARSRQPALSAPGLQPAHRASRACPLQPEIPEALDAPVVEPRDPGNPLIDRLPPRDLRISPGGSGRARRDSGRRSAVAACTPRASCRTGPWRHSPG